MRRKKHMICRILFFLLLIRVMGTAAFGSEAAVTTAAFAESGYAAEYLTAANETAVYDPEKESAAEAVPESGTVFDVSALNASGGMNTEIEVDPAGQREGFSAVLYDSMNGLPTSEANAIAETEEGFIWIGSYSGLIRFDGENFERMDSTTGIASVKCLYVDLDNRLWIGTNDSGLFEMDHGRVRNWDERSGLKASSIRSIVQGTDGLIYVATTNGLATIDSKMDISLMDEKGITDPFFHELRLGSDGTIYGLDNSGQVLTIEQGRPGRYLRFQGGRNRELSCILPDPSDPDAIYLATGDSSVYHCRIGESLEILDTIDISPLSQVQQFEYINDELWICTRNGIGVVDEDGFHKLENIPMDNSIGHVMPDYEGNLWFTSSRQGVMKIVPNQFMDLFERYKLKETVVNSTCRYGSQLFIGTDEGLTVLGEEGAVNKVPLTRVTTAGGTDLEYTDLLEMLDGVRIRSIIRDSRGRLWISTWRSYGILLYDEGRLTVFSVDDGLFSDQVRCVCERKDGSILAAGTGGISVIENGRVTAEYSEKDGIKNTEILTVAEGKNGDILAGSDGGGIYILGKDGTRCIGHAEGLTSEAVMRIKPDVEKDLYWIITGTSIAVLTGDYQLTTLTQFPYSNNFDLYDNGRGEMWILSSNGIYVTRKEELLANGKMNPLHYGRSDGLPCIATANSYSELTEERDLYIAGTTGVAKVNIEKTFDNVSKLKVAVPYIDADGLRFYPDADGGFSVPFSVRKLTVYVYVYNYSLINPQVSYYLEGFDQIQTTVSRSDLAPVDYTNLHGGTYHFMIRLEDSMGRGKQTASIRISKEKAVYEHALFYVLLGACILFALVRSVGLYVRARMSDLEKKHHEQAEKQRISSELNMAARLQESMLPHDYPPFPDRHEFDIFASMNPAREVGGDFYDYFLIDEDHLCLTIADVSGKGIPAALFMMISKVILKNSARLCRNASEVLTKTNEALCSNNQLEMFVTVWIGILEISTGIITAANAGHEYPAVKKDGKFTLLKDRHGLVVGAMDGINYKPYEIRLEPGDKLFVYTDGVPEATDSENHLFGTERMLQALNTEPGAEPQKILTNVRRAVDAFVKDAEQFDDLTMLCLEYKGS